MHEDDRGILIEGYRSDINPGYVPAMFYGSFTYVKKMRGPHEHKKQTDYFVFLGPGTVNFYLWDNRPKSSTYELKIKLTAGINRPYKIIVPPGVVHGYVATSEVPVLCLNFPDKLYGGIGGKEKVDEIRHEESAYSKFTFW